MTATKARWHVVPRMTVVALTAITVLATAACGDSADDDPPVASASDAATADPSETSDGAASDEQADLLVFAECMRDNGVDMPDPAPGQEGLMDALRGSFVDADEATVQAAFEACQDLIPQQAIDERQELDEETQLALAGCLRDQGLDVPDDLFSGDGTGLPEGITREDLMPAMEVCRDELDLDFGGNQ